MPAGRPDAGVVEDGVVVRTVSDPFDLRSTQMSQRSTVSRRKFLKGSAAAVAGTVVADRLGWNQESGSTLDT